MSHQASRKGGLMRSALAAYRETGGGRTRHVMGKRAGSALSLHEASCAQDNRTKQWDASAQSKDSVPGFLRPLEDECLENIEPHPDECGSMTRDLKSMA